MKTVETLEKEIAAAGYKKHGNEWNVANQLIDICAADERISEIVGEDLSNPDMGVKAMVKKITAKRLCDPVAVMKEICSFYSVPQPKELPPEHWRHGGGKSSDDDKDKIINIMDLL